MRTQQQQLEREELQTEAHWKGCENGWIQKQLWNGRVEGKVGLQNHPDGSESPLFPPWKVRLRLVEAARVRSSRGQRPLEGRRESE